MKQIIFGVYAEGSRDYKFFPALLQRYLANFCYVNGLEREILPAISIRVKEGSPSDFSGKMKRIEQDNDGLPYIFVHNDADARNPDRVLESRWKPWLAECANVESWLAVIPVRMTESWMLVDVEALSSTFIISTETIRQVIGTGDPESISEPKSRLAEIARQGKQKRITNFEENLAKRIRLDLLEQLPSFQFLKSQIEERIR